MRPMFLVLDRCSFAGNSHAGDQFLESEGMNLLNFIDTGLILAVLGGIAHILVKVGSMSTKIDTMWEWYKEHVR